MATPPTTDMDLDDDLLQRFEMEMMQLSVAPPLPMVISRVDLYFICSHLQLALRHPANHGPSSVGVEHMVRQMFAQIAPPGTAMAEVAARGWQPEHDVEVQPSATTPNSDIAVRFVSGLSALPSNRNGLVDVRDVMRVVADVCGLDQL